MSGLRERKKHQTRAAISAAALRLFAERGYDAVTFAEVAAAAEVGERTLFRYFPVKEELLFGEDEAFRAALASALAARPPAEPHAAALAAATAAVIAQIAGRRAELAARTAIIEADASLRARERAKQATFEPVIADGLVARGLERDAARLLARIGVACYGLALERWLADPDPTDPGLPARPLEAFDAARDVLTP